MELCCQQDSRRDKVRGKIGWNGLDYLEVVLDKPPATGASLSVYFLGKLPPEFNVEGQDLRQYLRLEGGRQIQNIGIVSVEAVVVDPNDLEKDDVLLVRLDKGGDFSIYTLRLVGLENVDKRYDHLDFSFKIDCPTNLDCVPPCPCEPPALVEPDINYLAKDYASFRQLILDRLAVIMPDWSERHVPDIGIALVELLAYTGDYLSYFQDAVATEAYLETARQRVSVRRHVRLVDYTLHEGCNSRAWLSIELSSDPNRPFKSKDIAFLTGLNNTLSGAASVLTRDELSRMPAKSYEMFEPLPSCPDRNLPFSAKRSKISFYTWGDRECCLAKGSVSATLLDTWTSADQAVRALDTLALGDVLIFEEVLGPKTGLAEDADPLRRCAVRITGISRGIDPIVLTDGNPTPYVEIRWSQEDALPFTFCITAQGQASECAYFNNISIARGNVLLVDFGQTLAVECLGEVTELLSQAVCECEGHPGEILRTPGMFRPRLSKTQLTFSTPLPADTQIAHTLLVQDVRAALPNLRVYLLPMQLRRLFGEIDPATLSPKLVDDTTGVWLSFIADSLPKALAKQYKDGKLPLTEWQGSCELVENGSDDHHFAVEISNDGVVQLRFGNGDLGYLLPAADTRILASAQAFLVQDVRLALPNLRIYSLSPDLRYLFGQIDPCTLPFSLSEDTTGVWLSFPADYLPKALVEHYKDGKLPVTEWQVRYDLLESGPDDRHFVVEIDNDGVVQLRFGDGDLGYLPEAGTVFFAKYRIGNGIASNVGAESITRLVLNDSLFDGGSITVRNPLPAIGGSDPEPIAEAKLFAPHDFRKRLERAITAADYRVIAERNVQLQQASAALVWTGSWYEADVAIDPLGSETPAPSLLGDLKAYLYRYRCMGHDLRVLAARYVPIDLKLDVCVLPHSQKAHVKEALLDAFSNRRLPNGKLGFFHADNLSFGVNIEFSTIVAEGMKIPGVECVRVTRLQRQFEEANSELKNGLLTLSSHEIAQLDNNPVYPERGKLELSLSGGR